MYVLNAHEFSCSNLLPHLRVFSVSVLVVVVWVLQGCCCVAHWMEEDQIVHCINKGLSNEWVIALIKVWVMNGLLHKLTGSQYSVIANKHFNFHQGSGGNSVCATNLWQWTYLNLKVIYELVCIHPFRFINNISLLFRLQGLLTCTKSFSRKVTPNAHVDTTESWTMYGACFSSYQTSLATCMSLLYFMVDCM